MTKPTIGFASLAEITPDADGSNDPIPTAKEIALEAVAERHGFKSREASAQRLVKRPVTTEPTANLSMRPPVSVFNRFVKFAIDNNLSNPDALRKLLDIAGAKK